MILIVLRNTGISQVPHGFLYPRQQLVTPVEDIFRVFTTFTSRCLLPAALPKASASTTNALWSYLCSPYGSGSYSSLSTLRICRYLQTRKTRYAVEVVSPSATGLSPVKSVQLLGARAIALKIT